MKIEGQIVDIYNHEIFEGSVEFEDGFITAINRHITNTKSYIMPGFVDAHLHIESSMLTPTEFAHIAMAQGSVGVVTDPHEIANVIGYEGVEFMMSNADNTPMKIHFTIPSSVPATPFDVAGGEINAADVEAMASSGKFVGLSEVMNVPGVLFRDEEVMAKLAAARKYGLAIDGHAPLLIGDDLTKYIESGITTDHECMTIEEAKEKLAKGMKILIREGSAAHNYNTLKELITTNTDNILFCTDDSHPDDILELGHINKIVKRAIADGFDLFDVLKVACINSIEHYKLEIGTLRVGDAADFIVVDDFLKFDVEKVYIDGAITYARGEEPRERDDIKTINNFLHDPIHEDDLRIVVNAQIPIIRLIENEIVTKLDHYTPKITTENLESDPEEDIIKIVYINRYKNGTPQVSFCHGFGLTRGAIASSIGHDSHNIVAVGCSDREITRAVNMLIEHHGGLVVCDGEQCDILPLPIAGIMSDKSGEEVAEAYSQLQEIIHKMGSPLTAPFMTLSFLSLVVIPEVKIGEKGLFSYSKFDWI